MKILLISFRFHPVDHVQTYRWTCVSEWLEKNGHHVTVLTSQQQNCQQFENYKGIDIVRVNIKRFNDFRLSIKKYDNVNYSKISYLNKIKYYISKMISGIWRFIYWPDSSCLFINSFYKKAIDIIKSSNYDIIISNAFPISMHFVTHKIKSIYPNIPIMYDYGDAWSVEKLLTVNNIYLYSSLNKWYESKIFKTANAITLTTREQLELYVKEFPFIKNKVFVVPPLFNIPKSPPTSKKYLSEYTNCINITYIGAFYRKVRSPDYTLSIFNYYFNKYPNSNVFIHIFANNEIVSDIINKYVNIIGTKIILHEPVPKDCISSIYDESNFLLNIGNYTQHHLPSKLVDYVSSKKPIIQFLQNITDCSSRFIEDYPSSIAFSEPIDKPNDNTIDRLHNFIINTPNPPNNQWVLDWLSKYSVETISNNYLTIINKTIELNNIKCKE